MPVVYLNGAFVDAADARISVFDRGLLLGDGVFETGRVHLAQYFRLEQHLRRLLASAAVLKLVVPPLQELAAIAHELLDHNPLTEASLRITITRGSGGYGLGRSGAGPTTILATLSPLPADWFERAAAGWKVRTASVRRPDVNCVPPQLKSLGRTYALLAHYEAEDAGSDDALLLSADGFIAEGPTWNLFWRTGEQLYTPSLDTGILEGVTRGLILDLARDAGYTVEQGRFTPEVLYAADEIFATMTSNGVVPFTALDDRALRVHAAAARLQSDYWTRVRRELGQKE